MGDSHQMGLDPVTTKQDLLSQEPGRQAHAIKKVIASMTIGKDMSSHFSDVAKLVASPNIEIKKLAYLYLMQNSKSQPEKAVLQAGIFVKDTTHESPLIRGIALRTMASMLVPAMVDFAHGPLLKCMRDRDPYVRRNAALGVLKLHHMAPAIAEETGVVDVLLELLSDPIAAVVASAVCVACEMHATGGSKKIASAIASKTTILLAALNDCAEWSQLYLLEGIALLFGDGYKPTVEGLDEAETTATRVLPLLQSGNPAVVMNAVRVVLLFLSWYCGGPSSPLVPAKQAELEKKYSAAIAQPVVSLVSNVRFELRYVALRCIKIIIQRYREILIPHVSSFFVKYDDPTYIKLNKIEVMLSLVTKSNGAIVLQELNEYSKEIDVEVVRRAVRSIGLLAIKVESLAAQCVECLVRLIESKINYVVQEAAVVVQTILRQYSNRFESVITNLCDALDVLDDAESKAAVAWVVGEYAERVENAVDILSLFLDSFVDEPLTVQLSVLTACAKAYLKADERNTMACKALFERVLTMCTNSEIPDLRDRGYFYYRLITTDPESARKVILAPKEEMADTSLMDKALRHQLIAELGCVSSVFLRPVSMVLGDAKAMPPVFYDDADEEIDIQAIEQAQQAAARKSEDIAKDKSLVSSVIDATFNFAAGSKPTAAAVETKENPMQIVLQAAGGGKGLEISMAWIPAASQPQLRVRFHLQPSSGVSLAKVVTMQLNTNIFCWGIGQEFPITELRSGVPVDVILAIGCNNQKRHVTDIQVAAKVEPLGVLFFVAPKVPVEAILLPSTPCDGAKFLEEFNSLQAAWSMPAGTGPQTSPDMFQLSALKLRGIYLVHSKQRGSLTGLHFSATTTSGTKIFAEATVENGAQVVVAAVKCSEEILAPLFGEYLLKCLAVPS